MLDIILYNKKVGQTPLEAILDLKFKNPKLQDSKITYAGRLDPMASGLLLLLKDKAIAEKNKYLNLPKIYEAQILLGVATDSLDILGLAKQIKFPKLSQKFETKIKTEVNNLIGLHTLPYPMYSSKTVNGKPLWELAQNGLIAKVTLPKRKMIVTKAKLKKISTIPWANIHKKIKRNIAKVSGNFRQQEILTSWDNAYSKINSIQSIYLIHLQLEVESGTYIRTLANQLGKKLNTPSLLYSLKRTSVGQFKLSDVKNSAESYTLTDL